MTCDEDTIDDAKIDGCGGNCSLLCQQLNTTPHETEHDNVDSTASKESLEQKHPPHDAYGDCPFTSRHNGVVGLPLSVHIISEKVAVTAVSSRTRAKTNVL